MTMETLYCILLGYLAGTVNPSYIIGKFKGFDIRKKGSGNAGGSNALIVMGKAVGFICMLFDIIKAFCIVKLTGWLFAGAKFCFPATAASVVLGHMFPFYMRFRGGKGLACMGGSLLAYSPLAFLIILAAEAVLAFSINYICVVPISCAVILPVIYGIVSADIYGALILGAAGIAVLLKHIENIRRIRNGTEVRLSYLWNKDKEIERVSE